MKFFIERIDSAVSAWNPELNTSEEKFSIVFGIKPLSNFRMDIDDNYVLCSDEYYTAHNSELIHRKKVCCSATILNSNSRNEEGLNISAFGYGRLIDDDLNFFIYLNTQTIFYLCNQINSMKKINDLFITFGPHHETGSHATLKSEQPNKLMWDMPQSGTGSCLEIKSFEFNCNLYQSQDSN